MVNIRGYEIPNTADELTVEQFDFINNLTKDYSLDNIEKEIAKFVYLGVPEEVFDDMDFDEFRQCVLVWNDIEPHSLVKTMEIDVDGFTYVAPESVGVKDLGLIEKAWKQGTKDFSAETLAIIYKRSDLTKKEHYAPAHIKHKTKIFKAQKASLAIPHIHEILGKLTDNLKKIKDESAAELESDNG